MVEDDIWDETPGDANVVGRAADVDVSFGARAIVAKGAELTSSHNGEAMTSAAMKSPPSKDEPRSPSYSST